MVSALFLHNPILLRILSCAWSLDHHWPNRCDRPSSEHDLRLSDGVDRKPQFHGNGQAKSVLLSEFHVSVGIKTCYFSAQHFNYQFQQPSCLASLHILHIFPKVSLSKKISEMRSAKNTIFSGDTTN